MDIFESLVESEQFLMGEEQNSRHKMGSIKNINPPSQHGSHPI